MSARAAPRRFDCDCRLAIRARAVTMLSRAQDGATSLLKNAVRLQPTPLVRGLCVVRRLPVLERVSVDLDLVAEERAAAFDVVAHAMHAMLSRGARACMRWAEVIADANRLSLPCKRLKCLPLVVCVNSQAYYLRRLLSFKTLGVVDATRSNRVSCDMEAFRRRPA
eukprot:5113270-Pleurochrysis_carterae.AAC.1